MNYKIPRGTFDIMPPESHYWQHLRRTFEEVAHSFGYEEITTPIFEMAELFERSSGESSDVVQKEMYRFSDQKGRNFALRPEGTAPVVRSYVENHLDKNAVRSKFYYMGPMFRYDRPQAGRYRQFYQYGIEFIGSDHPYYDAEVIALEMAYLKALGLKEFRLEINSVGCSDCAKDYEEALRKHYQPHLAKLCPDCQERYQSKPRRLLDCKVPSCKPFKEGAPSQLDFLDEDCKAHFENVKAYLNQMNVKYVVNPNIVRGLDYYTNTAFEVIVDSLGAQNSIAGGGRYNGLISQIGGRDTPAVGFAGGFERLLLALKSQGAFLPEENKAEAYLVAIGEEAEAFGIKVIQELRSQSLRVDYNPDKSSFKAQMKAADQSGAGFALLIGEDELAKGQLTLKNLRDSSQEMLSSKDVAAKIKAERA